MKYTNFFRFLVWVIVVILVIVVIAVWRNKRVSDVANNKPILLPQITSIPTTKPATPAPTAVPTTSAITTNDLPTSGPAENGLILAIMAGGAIGTGVVLSRRKQLQAAARSIEVR